MRITALAAGAATFIPGTKRFILRKVGHHTARYSYAVWMRHLVFAMRNGLIERMPRRVAELGPGRSLGAGIAAILSGVEYYRALDLVRHTELQHNLVVLDDLLKLFLTRSRVPDEQEFPELKPSMDAYDFPASMLLQDELELMLYERSRRIRSSIRRVGADDVIDYVAPWLGREVDGRPVDMLFSQAVLEHIDDLSDAYRAMYRWLRPGGFMSHQIDFKSHGTASTWNGHWTLPQPIWRIVRGRRPYSINRQPASVHLRLMLEAGFEIVHIERFRQRSRLKRDELAEEYRQVTDDDLTTEGMFVQAVKLK